MAYGAYATRRPSSRSLRAAGAMSSGNIGMGGDGRESTNFLRNLEGRVSGSRALKDHLRREKESPLMGHSEFLATDAPVGGAPRETRDSRPWYANTSKYDYGYSSSGTHGVSVPRGGDVLSAVPRRSRKLESSSSLMLGGGVSDSRSGVVSSRASSRSRSRRGVAVGGDVLDSEVYARASYEEELASSRSELASSRSCIPGLGRSLSRASGGGRSGSVSRRHRAEVDEDDGSSVSSSVRSRSSRKSGTVYGGGGGGGGVGYGGGSPRAVCGLANLGNTCFMNSTLQCLVHAEPLVALALRGGLSSEARNRKSATRGRMATAMEDLIRRMWSSSSMSRVERPSEVKSVAGRASRRFMGYDQQDAQEFLRFCVDAMHEDCNRVVSPPKYQELKEDNRASDVQMANIWWTADKERNDSVVADIFRGQLRSQVSCAKCGHISRCFDSFWDLSVPIPSSSSSSYSSSYFSRSSYSSSTSLDDCLSNFCAEESISKHGYKCEKCKAKACSKRFSLWRLPQVLVIHLKRFSYSSIRGSKIGTSVSFPKTSLDLSVYLEPGSPESAPFYDLAGVVNHSGSLLGGHYTADCRTEDGSFYRFNDSHTSTSSGISGSAAYLLFYVRRPSSSKL